MSDLPTDDELMSRLNAGEIPAFGELYGRYKAKVLTFLARLTGDRHTAEDLLQETFLRLWRSRETYRPSGQFAPWLFTIARHLATDDRRSRRPGLEVDDAAELLASRESSDRPVETLERLSDIDRVLAVLSSGQREIVLLSRLGGLDANEIAVVVGSTPGAIRVALHRALKRIHSALGS